ncbi:MAG: hypothetical protein ABI877_11015 [Gemmatimonadaceae bacterium]
MAVLDLTGRTTDGREWRAGWRAYRSLISDAPRESGQLPQWIVTVDGTILGGIQGLGSGLAPALVEGAVEDFLEEHGITAA